MAAAAEPPSLETLLSTHAAAIASLRAELGADLPECYDSLWLLRYVLSFPQVPERVEALRKGIAWRAANAGMLADAAAGRPPPGNSVIAALQVAGYHGATRRGDPLFVVRSALCQPVELMKVCSVEDFSAWLMYWREVGFLTCDRETRARGYLVKQLTVIDLKHSPLAAYDKKHFTALGNSGKVSEYVYPQLLRRSILIHPPAFFNTIFAFVKPFMSAKSLEKTTLCPGASAARPDFSACPFASALFDGADLPTFLGGSCRCTAAGGCICARPNEQCGPGPSAGPREAVVSVPARSVHDVMLTARQAGHELSYSFEVKDMGLSVSAALLPAAGGEEVELVPEAKHKAGGRVSAAVPVPAPGTVRLRFSNAHSLFTGKSVTVTARCEAALPAELAGGAAAGAGGAQ